MIRKIRPQTNQEENDVRYLTRTVQEAMQREEARRVTIIIVASYKERVTWGCLNG